MRTDLSVDLVLVRHAMPKIEPGAPAPSWRLGRAGRAAAAALGQFVPAGYLVSSDEPKALETAELVAAAHSEPCNDVVADRRLREVDRPNIWSDDGSYRKQAGDYVSGEPVEGWEACHDVAGRFGRSVQIHAMLAAAIGMPLILVGHGLAPTVWLTTVGRLTDPLRFWSNLGYPDAVLVPREAGRPPVSMVTRSSSGVASGP